MTSRSKWDKVGLVRAIKGDVRMFCPKCGTQLPNHVQFCNKCGNQVVKTSGNSFGKGKGKGNLIDKVISKKGNILKILLLVFGLVCCVLITKIAIDLMHDHTWQNATCTTPLTCDSCGEISGSPLGHNWKDATCMEPRTCTVCGLTEGGNDNHVWKDASCSTPKTCVKCGTTEGETLEHKVEDGKCVLCDKQMIQLTENTYKTYFTWDVEWIGNYDAKIIITPISGYRFSNETSITFKSPAKVKTMPKQQKWEEWTETLTINVDVNGNQTSVLYSELTSPYVIKRQLSRIYVDSVSGYVISD